VWTILASSRELIQSCSFQESGLIRGLMTDDEWAHFEPFLIRRGGRPSCSHRPILGAAFWLRTGGLPEEFGNWNLGVSAVAAIEAVAVTDQRSAKWRPRGRGGSIYPLSMGRSRRHVGGGPRHGRPRSN
jgi:hypothetical protein